jgi:hypothetical protein
VVRQVVVVFHWGEGGGLAEEAEVVGWDGGGEDGFECCKAMLVWCG